MLLLLLLCIHYTLCVSNHSHSLIILYINLHLKLHCILCLWGLHHQRLWNSNIKPNQWHGWPDRCLSHNPVFKCVTGPGAINLSCMCVGVCRVSFTIPYQRLEPNSLDERSRPDGVTFGQRQQQSAQQQHPPAAVHTRLLRPSPHWPTVCQGCFFFLTSKLTIKAFCHHMIFLQGLETFRGNLSAKRTRV